MSGIEELIQSVFKFSKLQQYDRKHMHFIALDSQYKYYIIVTTQTLRSSKRLFGRDFGEMLGVRSSILAQDFDYIVWVVRRETCIEFYMERTYRVNSFCLENRTVYRNPETLEYICNYPASRARKLKTMCVHKTLLDYLD
jgi:hypothetical protein